MFRKRERARRGAVTDVDSQLEVFGGVLWRCEETDEKPTRRVHLDGLVANYSVYGERVVERAAVLAPLPAVLHDGEEHVDA